MDITSITDDSGQPQAAILDKRFNRACQQDIALEGVVTRKVYQGSRAERATARQDQAIGNRQICHSAIQLQGGTGDDQNGPLPSGGIIRQGEAARRNQCPTRLRASTRKKQGTVAGQFEVPWNSTTFSQATRDC